MAVITPTGNSLWGITVLAIVSATTRNDAPKRKDAGNSSR